MRLGKQGNALIRTLKLNMEVLSSMSVSLSSEIGRILDEGAFTTSRINLHITMAECILRGLVMGECVIPPRSMGVMI